MLDPQLQTSRAYCPVNGSANDLDRLEFLMRERGILAAYIFADQAVKVYRTSVLHNQKRAAKPHFLSYQPYKERAIRSYQFHKRFVSDWKAQ